MDEWVCIDDLEQSPSKHCSSEDSNGSQSSSKINDLISDVEKNIINNEIEHNNVMFNVRKKVEDSYEYCSISTIIKLVHYQMLILYMRLKSIWI